MEPTAEGQETLPNVAKEFYNNLRKHLKDTVNPGTPSEHLVQIKLSDGQEAQINDQANVYMYGGFNQINLPDAPNWSDNPDRDRHNSLLEKGNAFIEIRISKDGSTTRSYTIGKPYFSKGAMLDFDMKGFSTNDPDRLAIITGDTLQGETTYKEVVDLSSERELQEVLKLVNKPNQIDRLKVYHDETRPEYYSVIS